MSYRKSQSIMGNTGNEFNLTGEPFKSNAYYNTVDFDHTVQVNFQNFTGGFGMQGTLCLNPTDTDWFWIKLTTDPDVKYITYPRDPQNPTGHPSTNVVNLGDTGSNSFNFTGKFTYVRAVLTRDYMAPTPVPGNDGQYNLGQINEVLINN